MLDLTRREPSRLRRGSEWTVVDMTRDVISVERHYPERVYSGPLPFMYARFGFARNKNSRGDSRPPIVLTGSSLPCP